jgi:transposase
MSKPIQPIQAMVFCGIDVSAASLAVAVQLQNRRFEERIFDNSAGGHKALIRWLHKLKARARVSLEATGVYSLDLALALDGADGIEVAVLHPTDEDLSAGTPVLNPKLIHRFAQTLRRSKTDSADAQVLAEYSARMPFTPWCAPGLSGLELRSISRHIQELTVEHARANNRLHAAESSASTPRCVVNDLKRSMASLKLRIARLRGEALELVGRDEAMRKRFELLIGMPGIAEISALQLLGELAALSPEMSVRQWVAHSGLDPAHRESGTSVHKPSRISRAGNRHLRRALYMPALVAVRWDPHLKAFYETLLSRHKAKLQALSAVARKLLHAIYGIFKSQMPYDGSKLFPQMQIA